MLPCLLPGFMPVFPCNKEEECSDVCYCHRYLGTRKPCDNARVLSRCIKLPAIVLRVFQEAAAVMLLDSGSWV
ncbi:hypothetical protein ILYODFUR_025626 [Ilyodon furcidens]|uniref:Secreted protein n=1 Tax=Ilyodon furcidens TaxID=33524 RepID=A0ABV0T0C7_9TELE